MERAAGLEPAKVCLEGRCNSHYAMLAYCNNKNWKDFFRVILSPNRHKLLYGADRRFDTTTRLFIVDVILHRHLLHGEPS